MAEVVVPFQGMDRDDQLSQALRARLAEIDREREALVQSRRELDAALNKADEERGHIAALLGLKEDGGQAAIAASNNLTDDPVELVVKLLRERGPLHYRDIERELRSRGWFQAGGADPANTLLAKYFQDPRLYRPARGVYALRPEGKTVQSVGTKRKGIKRGKRGSGRKG